MAIKPILFNTEMVRAILDGRKDATRRIVKGFIPDDAVWGYTVFTPKGYISCRGTFADGYRWNGMLQQNMKHKENRIHPTQKPVALYEWLLNSYAKPGDIILDTHVGSASSLIACYRTNHPYVGFELDKHYYDLSKKRLDAEMAQMRLSDFMPEVLP